MKKDDFVKWTSQDKEGEFSHSGQIVSITEKKVKLRTARGVMEFGRNDGTLEPCEPVDLTPPSSFAEGEVAASAQASETTTAKEKKEKRAPRKRSTGDGPTKAELALELVKNNPKATRKELIELLKDKLKMTPAGASTYVHNAKKALEKEQ